MAGTKRSKIISFPKMVIKTIYFPVFSGLFIGWLIYGIIVYNAYNSLACKIKNVNVFDKIIERDPAFYALVNDSNFIIRNDEELEHLEWRLLTNLGVIPSTKSTDEISHGIKTRLDRVFVNHPGTNIASITFMDLFIETLDLNTQGQPVNKSQNKSLKNYISDCIARKPQSLYYLAYYNKHTDRLNDGIPGKSTWYRYFIPRAINQELWGGDVNLNNVLGILYEKNEFHKIYKDLPDSVANVSEDVYEDYRQLREFHQRLLMSLNDVPGILKAKNHIFYVEGPEQLAMAILTAIALIMLLQRVFRVKKIMGFSELEDRYFMNIKRWFKWITVSMPLFGFIGTKRGLSEALSQSDSIIRSGSEINQAMTMNNVTYSLGIAFTTTLVALVLSLMLNFLDNIVKGFENDFEID